MDKIKIRQKQGAKGTVMTGANTLVTMNGEPIKGISGITFEVKACHVAKITLEMVAEVDIEGEFMIGQITRVTKKDMEKE